MKKIVLSVLALCLATAAFAQEDTTGSTMNQPVRKPLELSWEQTEVGDFSELVPYVYQRNADVMYYHTIWRTIDLREKMNHPLYFPQETRGTWRSMAQVIFDAIDVDHVSIRFNLANEKVNNLKEYTIKLIKHELTDKGLAKFMEDYRNSLK